jgi:hypothetical protein
MVYYSHDLIDIIDIGAATRDPQTNVITINGKGVNLSDDPDNNTDDAEDFSDCATFGALGVTSMPAPADSTGQCQGTIARNLNCFLGMRDTRIADVVGQLQPGDTCLHATGPSHRARIVIKEATDSVTIMAKDKNGQDVIITLGALGLSMQCLGNIFQQDETGTVIGFKGNQIIINEQGITIGGKQVGLGSGPPIGGVVMGVPQTAGIGPAAPAIVCSDSVYVCSSIPLPT